MERVFFFFRTSKCQERCFSCQRIITKTLFMPTYPIYIVQKLDESVTKRSYQGFNYHYNYYQEARVAVRQGRYHFAAPTCLSLPYPALRPHTSQAPACRSLPYPALRPHTSPNPSTAETAYVAGAAIITYHPTPFIDTILRGLQL